MPIDDPAHDDTFQPHLFLDGAVNHTDEPWVYQTETGRLVVGPGDCVFCRLDVRRAAEPLRVYQRASDRLWYYVGDDGTKHGPYYFEVDASNALHENIVNEQ